ncbi:MAG: DUF3822 family protein [Bacteroidales bacterium]|nr:DUF3822 family protein [Bacteroidales bacterium]
MTQSPLTKDLIARPDMWRLSIEICDDALDAVARSVVGDGEMLSARIALADASASSLEEAVYANPLLLAPFRKVDVVVRTSSYVIVPPAVADDDETVEALMAQLAGDSARELEAFVSHVDKRNSIVASINTSVANFVRRTFDTAVPVHHLSVLSRFFAGRSALGNTGKVYVNLREDATDVVAFNSLGLAAATTFAASATADSAYYVLAVAKVSGHDPATDEFLLAGDPGRRAVLTRELQRFAAYVMPAIFPTALLAAGRDAMSAPLELTVLPLCE